MSWTQTHEAELQDLQRKQDEFTKLLNMWNADIELIDGALKKETGRVELTFDVAERCKSAMEYCASLVLEQVTKAQQAVAQAQEMKVKLGGQ